MSSYVNHVQTAFTCHIYNPSNKTPDISLVNMAVFNITCLRWRHTYTDGSKSSQQNSDVKKRTRHFLTNCQKTSEDNAKKTDNNRRLAIYEYF